MAKRQLAGGIILCLALVAPLAAEAPASAVLGTLPQPGWAQLTSGQRDILSPLSADWDTMENIRRKKWLGIAERYPTMNPDEQHRIQRRMRQWTTLTPEQRTRARDTYKDFNQLPAEQKQLLKHKWKAYSNLPAEEKQRIRTSGKSSKLLNPPPPETIQPAAPTIPENIIHPPAPASQSTAEGQP